MRNLLICILLSFSIAFNSSGQLINTDLKITHGPYIQIVSKNEVTIIWMTNLPAVPGILLDAENENQQFIQNSHDGLIDGGGVLHKVNIKSLKPGVKYHYKIFSCQILKYQPYKVYYGDSIYSHSYSFYTPLQETSEIKFAVFADVHEKTTVFSKLLSRTNINDCDLIFFNGDMVNYFQERDQLFTGFIDTAVAYFASEKPFYYVRGNHETRGMLARELKNYFEFKNDHFYYSFDHGPVHFVVLDCGEDKSDTHREYSGLVDFDSYRIEQLEWLKEEVESESFKEAPYRVVLVHIPIAENMNYWEYGRKFLVKEFGPVLEKANIDLMLSGHTHRTEIMDKGESGFTYPVITNSNVSFLEVNAGPKELKVVIKNIDGNIEGEYIIPNY